MESEIITAVYSCFSYLYGIFKLFIRLLLATNSKLFIFLLFLLFLLSGFPSLPDLLRTSTWLPLDRGSYLYTRGVLFLFLFFCLSSVCSCFDYDRATQFHAHRSDLALISRARLPFHRLYCTGLLSFGSWYLWSLSLSLYERALEPCLLDPLFLRFAWGFGFINKETRGSIQPKTCWQISLTGSHGSLSYFFILFFLELKSNTLHRGVNK